MHITLRKAKKENKVKKVKAKKPFDRSSFTLGMVILCLLLSGASLYFSLVSYLSGTPTITIASHEGAGNTASFVKEGSISDIASRVSPSVVSITTETRTMSWFGQESTSSAAGTGVIVSSDGYILTNKHVISGANKISVVMSNGTIYSDVDVATTDPLNDIAFLKIQDAHDLPAATIGDSKTIHTGQEVIAIGNALGTFSNSVTFGIISGTGRTITATDSSYSSYETLSDLIQTDAAINAGNSGGPLVNAAGEVIGINSATSGDGYNISFAIPVAAVRGMLDQLLSTGEAHRAFLGVTSISITPDVAKSYDLPVVAGAYLYYSSGRYISSAISKDSPAMKAGLQDKDIITAVNGQKIGESGSLSTLIGEYKPGDTVQLTIIRAGSEKSITVTLGSYVED